MVKLFSVIVFSCFFNLTQAQFSNDFIQKNIPNPLPPSPDAFNFTKFGGIPIGLNTGTAQFDIPIYQIQSGTLSHNLSLNYSSNGVKVDEISSRVGMNWLLNVGGTITRTIMDKPDDATAVYPTFYNDTLMWGIMGNSTPNHYDEFGNTDGYNFDPRVWNFYWWIRRAADPVPPDYQPDEYSFNVDGYSGKFLRRQNGKYTLLNSNGFKIEKIGNSFLLIAPTGTKYYFEISEISKHEGDPMNLQLQWQPSPVPTSWFLTKIVSSSGQDQIEFEYENLSMNPNGLQYVNGISQEYNVGGSYGFILDDGGAGHFTDYGINGVQSLFQPPEGGLYNTSPDAPSGIFTNVIKTSTTSKMLKEVSFKQGRILFTYSEREDVIGEKKLEKIEIIRNSDNKVIKQFNLGFTYSFHEGNTFDTYNLPGENLTSANPSLRKRLFLNEFKHSSTTSNSEQVYKFEYNDFDALPPRLSFSQDRYGFFNGKHNDYFFPNDTWYRMHLSYQIIGGDRSYDYTTAQKGMLNKIIYPTGGFTKFIYEPQKTEKDYAFIYDNHEVSSIVDTSSTNGQIFYSQPITYSSPTSILQIKGNCEWASTTPTFNSNGQATDFEEEYYLKIEIINVQTNVLATPATIIRPGDNFFNGTLSVYGNPIYSGTYKLKITANRKRLKGSITLLTTRKISDRSELSGICGVRIKSILDYSSANTEANRREFLYGDWDDENNSSGTGLYFDEGHNGNDVSLTLHNGVNAFGPTRSSYNTIHSNSVSSNFITEKNTVFYKKVIELFTTGGTKNNGGIEYNYDFENKETASKIVFTWPRYVWHMWPLLPSGAPYANNDFKTGTLVNQKTFSYETIRGPRKIISETENFYSVEQATLAIDTFKVSKQIFSLINETTWPNFLSFIVYKYYRYYGFLKLDKTIETTYTDQGSLSKTINYNLYSPIHFKPRAITTLTSKGEERGVSLMYSSDVLNSDPQYSVASTMVNANVLIPVFRETQFLAGSLLATNKSKFRTLSSGLFVPTELFSKRGSNADVSEVKFEEYDVRGNLLQFSTRAGITTCYLWGYDKQYPVAKIIGSTFHDISELINQSILDNPASDEQLKDEINLIRQHFTTQKVFVTSYTYSPLIGITSETDANNKSIFYEYDEFNRLSLVRNNEKSILKKFCYNYHGQITNCGFGTRPNWIELSRNCQVNDNGATGNAIVIEKDFNPESSSYNDTRTTIVQDASCICNGEDRRIVGGKCVNGLIQCWGNFRNPGEQWKHFYRYTWSDGVVSPIYIGEGICEIELEP